MPPDSHKLDCRLFTKLASDPGNRAPIVAKGGIKVAIAAMRGHPGDFETQLAVANVDSELPSLWGVQDAGCYTKYVSQRFVR